MESYKTCKAGQATARKYADILDKERPQSEESLRRHPRMSLQNRAKIFSPFAALRGYDEQLAEEKQRSERVTQKLLTEEEMAELSNRLLQVTKGMTVTVQYFKADTAYPEDPPVGIYCEQTGIVTMIDPVYRVLQIGQEKIPFDTLSALQGEQIMEIDAWLGLEEDE